MSNLRVIDNDRDEISVMSDGKQVRGWSYADESERRVKMLCAREFVEGFYHNKSLPSDWQSEAGQLTYRKHTIYYDPPPIPIRTMDYHYYHDDYDGAEDANDHRHGSSSSIEACKAEIDAWYEEQDMRLETTSEHIARDMREGRFPERSEVIMTSKTEGGLGITG